MIRFCFILVLMNCSAIALGQDLIEVRANPGKVPIQFEKCFKDEILELQLSSHIVDFALDTTQYVVYLSSRGSKKGYRKDWLTAYSLKEMRVLWSAPMAVDKENLVLFQSHVLLSSKNYTRAINTIDGSEKWTKPVKIVAYVPGLNKLITTSTVSGSDIDLLDIQTGKVEWVHRSDFPINLADFRITGDTSLTSISSRIHYINLKDGKSWNEYLEIKTNQSQVASSGGAIAAGVAAGLIGAMFGYIVIAVPITYTTSKKVGSEQGNVIVEVGAIYVANNSEVMRFDAKGRRIWTCYTMQAQVTLPTVISREDDLIVVNNGYAFTQNGPVYSASGVLRIDKETGKILAESEYSAERKEFLIDYLLLENSIVLIGNNRLVELNIDDLKPISNIKLSNTTSSIGLKRIISSQGYIKENDAFTYLGNTFDEYYLFENTAGGKIKFNLNMEMLESISKYKYFSIVNEFGDLLIITNGKDSYFITRDGEIISGYEPTQTAKFIGRNYVEHMDSRLIMMKIK